MSERDIDDRLAEVVAATMEPDGDEDGIVGEECRACGAYFSHDPDADEHHNPGCALEAAIDFAERLRAREDGEASEASRVLYYNRCGWCGAYEGTVDASEPCARDHETGDYIGPHQFDVYERAAPVPVQDEGDEDGPINESDVTATVRLALFYLRHNDLFPDEAADEMEEHLWHVLAEAGEHDAHAWLKSHAATTVVRTQEPSKEES